MSYKIYFLILVIFFVDSSLALSTPFEDFLERTYREASAISPLSEKWHPPLAATVEKIPDYVWGLAGGGLPMLREDELHALTHFIEAHLADLEPVEGKLSETQSVQVAANLYSDMYRKIGAIKLFDSPEWEHFFSVADDVLKEAYHRKCDPKSYTYLVAQHYRSMFYGAHKSGAGQPFFTTAYKEYQIRFGISNLDFFEDFLHFMSQPRDPSIQGFDWSGRRERIAGQLLSYHNLARTVSATTTPSNAKQAARILKIIFQRVDPAQIREPDRRRNYMQLFGEAINEITTLQDETEAKKKSLIQAFVDSCSKAIIKLRGKKE
jgi:hypothetical protein